MASSWLSRWKRITHSCFALGEVSSHKVKHGAGSVVWTDEYHCISDRGCGVWTKAMTAKLSEDEQDSRVHDDGVGIRLGMSQ